MRGRIPSTSGLAGLAEAVVENSIGTEIAD
jgi:hypothetical protein